MSAQAPVTTPRASAVSESSKTPDSILKILLPLGLAVMAGLLNASAVSRQMRTQTYLSFQTDLPIGHVLTEADLAPIDLGGETSQLNVQPAPSDQQLVWMGRVLGQSVKKGELIEEKHFGGVELGTSKEETLLLSTNQFGQNEAGLLQPGQWLYFTCYRKGDQAAPEQHVGPFRVASYDAQRKSDSDGGVLLIYTADDKGRRERRRLVEYLDDDSYRVTATVLGAKPIAQLAANTAKK